MHLTLLSAVILVALFLMVMMAAACCAVADRADRRYVEDIERTLSDRP
jgi:hypothetical protein